jgi:exonuclease III
MNPPARAPTLRLLTVNVNSLRGERTPRLLCFSQQVARNPDFTFIQEAKLGSKEDM